MSEYKINDKNYELSEYDNLLLNMMGGLLPEHLSIEECNLIEANHGKDWFLKLGYNTETYNLPITYLNNK